MTNKSQPPPPGHSPSAVARDERPHGDPLEQRTSPSFFNTKASYRLEGPRRHSSRIRVEWISFTPVQNIASRTPVPFKFINRNKPLGDF